MSILSAVSFNFSLVIPGKYFFPKTDPDYGRLSIESGTSNICAKKEKSCTFKK